MVLQIRSGYRKAISVVQKYCKDRVLCLVVSIKQRFMKAIIDFSKAELMQLIKS